jgi:DNA-binding Lrp family transcriptional regulator
MKGTIDSMDLMILKELQENCKRPIRELAEKLNIHSNTLLQRIKRLEKSKVIRKYRADIDYHYLGYDMHAIVMIKIRKSGLEDDYLLKDVSSIPEVESLYAVTGSTDCIAVVREKNMDDMVRVLRAIQLQKPVMRTTSYFVLVRYKESYQSNPLLAGAVKIK